MAKKKKPTSKKSKSVNKKVVEQKKAALEKRIVKYSEIGKVKTAAFGDAELLEKERSRVYQLRYRLKKRLDRTDLPKREKEAIRGALRASTRSLAKLRNEPIPKQAPMRKEIEARNEVLIRDVMKWEAMKVVEALVGGGAFNKAIIDDVEYKRFNSNAPYVFAAVDNLVTKADLIGDYYFRLTLNVKLKYFILEIA